VGVFDKLFGRVPRLITYWVPGARSAPWSRNAYEQDIVRSVIDCIASHAAKAEAMHIRIDEHGRIKENIWNSPYSKMLNMQPNPLMSGFELKYKLVSQLESTTTALCYIKWDGMNPVMILPIAFQGFEILPVKGGTYAVTFTDIYGNEVALNIEDVVVMRKFYSTRDVSGDGNEPVYNVLSMQKSADEGLVDALAVSNKVRGILKQKKSMLDSEDVKRGTEQFAARFEEAAKKGGIVGVDSMEDFTPLNITAWATNAAQTQQIRNRILAYYRVSDAIVTSSYTDVQWQSFYESVIEPILIAMGQAFTNACFTPREKDVGNRIVFASDILVNMSMSAKTTLLSVAKETGLFTVNEQRAMFGYHPVEGGDVRQISLNYVKDTDQSAYQTGKEPAESQPTPQDESSIPTETEGITDAE
jgi:HK97 family phage portal protein